MAGEPLHIDPAGCKQVESGRSEQRIPLVLMMTGTSLLCEQSRTTAVAPVVCSSCGNGVSHPAEVTGIPKTISVRHGLLAVSPVCGAARTTLRVVDSAQCRRPPTYIRAFLPKPRNTLFPA